MKCNQKDETINPIASECPALAQNQYKERHDTVVRTVHWNLCKKYQMPCSNKWYEHQPQPVTENENTKLLWDYSIRTDRVTPAHRPDLTLVEKTNKMLLIDVTVPWYSTTEQKEQEKKEVNTKTYQLSSGDCGVRKWNSSINHWGIMHYTQVLKEDFRRIRS